MKVLLDTSVLIAAVVVHHTCHVPAFAVLERVQSGNDSGLIASHSLAEMYAVLTRLPIPFRHSPEQALLSIEENVIRHFKMTALQSGDYVSLIREAAISGLQGGTIYDALLLKSAAHSKPDRIYTLNLRHFQAIVPPNLAPLLRAP